MRVLIADDDRDSVDAHAIFLEGSGMQVDVAYDGATAVELARAHRPDVAILDLGMPGMNGLEVARRMREDPEMRGITLVALTGWGQREDRRRTHEAGFDYHLVKPADVGVLQSILMSQGVPASTVRH